jgi:hypothetical protein
MTKVLWDFNKKKFEGGISKQVYSKLSYALLEKIWKFRFILLWALGAIVLLTHVFIINE